MNESHEGGTEATVETTPTPEVASASAPEVAAVEAAPASKKQIRVVIALALVLVVAALAYYFLVFTQKDVVAVVNGDKIRQAELDESIGMVTQAAALQGADVADPAILAEIRTNALDTLVNNALLLGAAKDAGMSAEEAQVKEQYEALKTQMGGEEELKARMAEVGITEEKLLTNIKDRIVVDAYIEAYTDIETATVTPEEVATYYESLKANGGDVPPLDDIRSQIEGMLLSEKQQNVVSTLLTDLREKATISIKDVK